MPLVLEEMSQRIECEGQIRERIHLGTVEKLKGGHLVWFETCYEVSDEELDDLNPYLRHCD